MTEDRERQTMGEMPERQEAVDTWREFESAKREIDRLRDSFRQMGIEIE